MAFLMSFDKRLSYFWLLLTLTTGAPEQRSSGRSILGVSVASDTTVIVYCHLHQHRSYFVFQCYFPAFVNPFACTQAPAHSTVNFSYSCQDHDWYDGCQKQKSLHRFGKCLGFLSSVWSLKCEKLCEECQPCVHIYPQLPAVVFVLKGGRCVLVYHHYDSTLWKHICGHQQHPTTTSFQNYSHVYT